MKKVINEYYQSIRPQMVASFMKFGQLPEGIDLKEKVNSPIYNNTVAFIAQAYCLSEDTVRSIIADDEQPLTESNLKKTKKESSGLKKIKKDVITNEDIKEIGDPDEGLSPVEEDELDDAELALEGNGTLIEAPYVPGKIEKALDEALKSTMRNMVGTLIRDKDGNKIPEGKSSDGKTIYKRHIINTVDDMTKHWGGKFELDVVPNNNVLLVGTPGVGKTERVKSWCKHNGLELIVFKGDSLTEDDFEGIPMVAGEAKLELKKTPDTKANERKRVKLAYYGTFDQLDDKKGKPCIIFIDEFNRAKPGVMQNWMQILQGHKIPSKELKNKDRYLHRLIFAVAAMNPAVLSNGKDVEGDDTEKLKTAMLDRFADKQIISADRKETLAYLQAYYKAVADYYPHSAKDAMNKYDLATHILNTAATVPETEIKNGKSVIKKDENGKTITRVQGLHFATDVEADAAAVQQEKFLSPRGLSNAIMACDGTKEDLLSKLPNNVGPAGTEQIESILASYKKLDNKANAVWEFWKKKGLDIPKESIGDEPAPSIQELEKSTLTGNSASAEQKPREKRRLGRYNDDD